MNGLVRLDFIFLSGTLVGVDDLLHQGVADHVCRCQAADGNIFHALKYTHRILQTGGFISWKIDLSNITGNDDLGAKAQAGEEHFHLLAGGVLSLVENDE